MKNALILIFCDIGGVLVLNDAPLLYREFESVHGIHEAQLREVWRFIHSSERSDGELHDELTRIGVTLDLWNSFVSRFRISEHPNTPLIEFLLSLTKRGQVVIFATSNNNRGNPKEFSSMLERFGIARLVERIILSSELGVTKPDPEFWIRVKQVGRNYGLSPSNERILVIDDDQRNCESARSLGFKAIHYSAYDEMLIQDINQSIATATS